MYVTVCSWKYKVEKWRIKSLCKENPFATPFNHVLMYFFPQNSNEI